MNEGVVMTETVLDIEALVGPMENQECEHSEHVSDKYKVHGGPATHYGHPDCKNCGRLDPMMALCATFVNAVHRRGSLLKCLTCGRSGPALERIVIDGPIQSFMK